MLRLGPRERERAERGPNTHQSPGKLRNYDTNKRGTRPSREAEKAAFRQRKGSANIRDYPLLLARGKRQRKVFTGSRTREKGTRVEGGRVGKNINSVKKGR